ncbi:condensin subunit BRN1 [Ascoidea rubescens DSM 1968]|uniref:Condensin complex subunit 2 n=1 Tax=Ascoidea rubescens DSM 1968 TaxID=1344418 RepID=A0A1D2VBF1_9ASCO|nr:barren-domain-containing protein [Ascoidea rubescens DSM 1968]ODV58930.1 barren-domain-containing protein [Ascoidea rubescens DSM 1968]
MSLIPLNNQKRRKISNDKKLGRRVSGALIFRQQLTQVDDTSKNSNDLSNILTTTIINTTTNRNNQFLDDDDDDDDDQLLMDHENFEEWIRMTTDNKINIINSWNVKLIDYFHDLRVLKDDKNNINFQKASTTLDGCMKVYSSRVDSVATETGKLLTGLGTKSKNSKADGNGDQNDDGDPNNKLSNDQDINEFFPDENNSKKKERKNRNRFLETTLVKDFDELKIKKLEQEFQIDPLFKKALSEFDEGGAKSLLLNNLDINKEGRVVFDTGSQNNEIIIKDYDDNGDQSIHPTEIGQLQSELDEEKNDKILPEKSEINILNFSTIDFSFFKKILYRNNKELENLSVCKKISQIEEISNNVGKSKNLIDNLLTIEESFVFYGDQSDENPFPFEDSKFLEANDITENNFSNGNKNVLNSDEQHIDNNIDFFPNDDMDMPAFEDINNNFNDEDDDNDEDDNDHQEQNDSLDQIGALSNKAAAVLNTLIDNEINDDDNFDIEDPNSSKRILDVNIMAYFDNQGNKNWAGPLYTRNTHWKINAFKKNTLGIPSNSNEIETKNDSNESFSKGINKKKNKLEFTIDFFSDDIDEEILFKSSKTSIDLPAKQRISKDNNLLPKDLYFSSSRLIHFFLKPDDNLAIYVHKGIKKDTQTDNYIEEPKAEPDNGIVHDHADEKFFANAYEDAENEKNEKDNFYQDDIPIDAGADVFDDDFGDAYGMDVSQVIQRDSISPSENFGSNSSSRRRGGDTVSYSKIAKRVDVKMLKDNLWSAFNTVKKEKEKISSHRHSEENQKENQKENQEEDKTETEEQVNGSKLPLEVDNDIKFSDIVKNTSDMYSLEERRDLSTSYFFICVLHLANENGLTIEGDVNYSDFRIKGMT